MRLNPITLAFSTVVGLLTFSALASAQIGTLTTITGKISDLSTDSSGNLIYCTVDKEIGRISTSGTVTVLANATTGPFANPLRGVAETPSGDIAVVDSIGDIYKLPSGTTPAVKVYTDYFLVGDPTDLAVDTAGNYIVTSSTPTSFVRAIDWISPDGLRWTYYLVANTPVAIAADPLTGKMLMADATSPGSIRLVDTADEAHSTTIVDNSVAGNFAPANLDGDMAVASNGDFYYVGGSRVYYRNRAAGITSGVAAGLQPLHGCAIAASSGLVASSTGWSLYLAEGNGPSNIREIGNAEPPASLKVNSLGTVPSRGNQLSVNFGFNCNEMTSDVNGNLIIGGDNYGTARSVKRVNMPALTVSTIATAANGLSDLPEGICALPNGDIYVACTNGVIQKITEGPVNVSTFFNNSPTFITSAKDILMGRDGTAYVADRTGFGFGTVDKIPPTGTGSPVHMISTQESRGIEVDAASGKPMVVQWVNTGFVGTVSTMNTTTGALTLMPGFAGVNYTNGGVWSDGDLVEDCMGNIYTCSEDDFAVHKYNRYTGKLSFFSSGYVNHLAGVSIGKSTAGSGSTTGWSLFVAEWYYLWEIPSVPAPATKNRVDTAAPGTGRGLGFLPPAGGTPRAIVADPAGGFYVTTSTARLFHVAASGGLATEVINSSGGLGGDLVGAAMRSNGKLVLTSRTGVVFDVNPTAAYTVTVEYANTGPQFNDVRGVTVDSQDRAIVMDRGTGSNASRLYRQGVNGFDLLNHTNRGVGVAFDPLTGDLFCTEQGTAAEGGGEILRVNTFATPAEAGHFKGDSYYTFKIGDLDGGICFDASGNFYVVSGPEGRVYRVDRTTGARTVFAGNFDAPSSMTVAAGTPGVAGPGGYSLFVLDGYAIYEIGINGSAPGAPPATNPGLAPSADLTVSGYTTLGSANTLTVRSPSDANRMVVILPTLSGKVPGFALNTLSDPLDVRVLPNNPDYTWDYVGVPSIMPDFITSLDATGQSPPTSAILIPSAPSILGLNQFLDFTWISIDPLAQNGIARIGGTAQLFLGQ